MNFNGNFRKVGHHDIGDIADYIASIPEERWAADASRQQRFVAHKHTQTIKLIMDEDFRHTNPTAHADYAEFRSVLDPCLARIRRFYDGSVSGQRLRRKHGPGYFIRIIAVRLLPAGDIPAHQDTGMSLTRSHRVHIPVTTNDRVLFRVGDETVNLRPGDLWEINNRRLHTVKNAGDTIRVHLIADYVLPGEKVLDADGSTIEC